MDLKERRKKHPSTGKRKCRQCKTYQSLSKFVHDPLLCRECWGGIILGPERKVERDCLKCGKRVKLLRQNRLCNKCKNCVEFTEGDWMPDYSVVS